MPNKHGIGWLSDDLWARVFRLLQPDLCEQADSLGIENVDADQEYISFHQLRLTCKAFNKVFQQCEELSDCMYLSEHTCHTSLPSLLSWSRRYSSSVTTFVAASETPYTEVALAALSGARAQLTTAVLGETFDHSILTLCAFTSLTTCDLHAAPKPLDLAPLRTLPGLTDLYLRHGRYDVSAMQAGLTYLKLEEAQVTTCCKGNFVGTLQCLDVTDSKLKGPPEMSLSCYTALVTAFISNAEIGLDGEDTHLDIRADTIHRLPARLSALNCLTSLSLQFYSSTLDNVDYAGLYMLVNLEHLDLLYPPAANRVNPAIDSRLTQLSKLEHFRVHCGHDYQNTLTLDVSWQLLVNLCVVDFHAGSFQFGQSILGFMQLKCLKRLAFRRGRPINDMTAGCFGALLYNMARHCPDVQVELPSPLCGWHDRRLANSPSDFLSTFRATL